MPGAAVVDVRTVAIIQARMDSKRLPGKAVELIGDKTILEWVIYRALLTPGVDEVVVATSYRLVDAQIDWTATHAGVRVVRGSADDVLDRYLVAATATDADYILRLTADCPLHDPGLNGWMLEELKATFADYVSLLTFSVGLAQEVFTVEALQRAGRHAKTAYAREHVVPWMLCNTRTLMRAPPFVIGVGRWCVDTPEDLERLRGLYSAFPDLFEMSASELVGLGVAGVS